MSGWGAQADPKRLKVAADAHHKAIGSISGAACSASLASKDVVKKDQVASAGLAGYAPFGDGIGAAANKLSDAAYPLRKEVDWSSDLFMKPLPGASSD